MKCNLMKQGPYIPLFVAAFTMQHFVGSPEITPATLKAELDFLNWKNRYGDRDDIEDLLNLVENILQLTLMLHDPSRFDLDKIRQFLETKPESLDPSLSKATQKPLG